MLSAWFIVIWYDDNAFALEELVEFWLPIAGAAWITCGYEACPVERLDAQFTLTNYYSICACEVMQLEWHAADAVHAWYDGARAIYV
jgi:hypothetical protein